MSPASISVRFRPQGDFALPADRYGEPGGKLTALDGSFRSAGVTHAGRSGSGAQLFDARNVTVRSAGPWDGAVAHTRVIFAGAAWTGATTVAGRPAQARRLSVDVSSHHDARLALAFAGGIDGVARERLELAVAFCAGIGAPALCEERYDDAGTLREAEYLRGFRRVGRYPHSPFPADDAVALAALAAVDAAIPRLVAEGVPIEYVLDEIAASNVVAQINVSSQMLMLAVQTLAAALAGGSFGGLLRRLDLVLSDADLERLTALRAELLDRGYYGPPGYDTGRPQRDIKLIRDVAHTAVFRLCAYAGPYWSSERARLESFA